jgi:hypothetical protein
MTVVSLCRRYTDRIRGTGELGDRMEGSYSRYPLYVRHSLFVDADTRTQGHC